MPEILDGTYQYPPELFALLVETIPLLNRSKQDCLVFFRGAGVAAALMQDLQARVSTDRTGITKYEIVRTVLERLNERGDKTLGQRRELLKRVTEFDEFSVCWDTDQLKARGLVAQIRSTINVKDTFTRINLEREQERKQRQAQFLQAQQDKVVRREKIRGVKGRLFAVFGLQDPCARGLELEKVLNELFAAFGILVRESFKRLGTQGEGVVEQIDGVIELDGQVYLVEVKWHKEPLGVPEVAAHLVRVFNRGQARGVLISATGFTEPSITTVRESLSKAVFVLCGMDEVTHVLEAEADLKGYLKAKVQSAIIDKVPLHIPQVTRTDV